jgi:hypothetical protein
MINEYGAVGGMRIDMENLKYSERSCANAVGVFKYRLSLQI